MANQPEFSSHQNELCDKLRKEIEKVEKTFDVGKPRLAALRRELYPSETNVGMKNVVLAEGIEGKEWGLMRRMEALDALQNTIASMELKFYRAMLQREATAEEIDVIYKELVQGIEEGLTLRYLVNDELISQTQKFGKSSEELNVKKKSVLSGNFVVGDKKRNLAGKLGDHADENKGQMSALEPEQKISTLPCLTDDDKTISQTMNFREAFKELDTKRESILSMKRSTSDEKWKMLRELVEEIIEISGENRDQMHALELKKKQVSSIRKNPIRDWHELKRSQSSPMSTRKSASAILKEPSRLRRGSRSASKSSLNNFRGTEIWDCFIFIIWFILFIWVIWILVF